MKFGVARRSSKSKITNIPPLELTQGDKKNLDVAIKHLKSMIIVVSCVDDLLCGSLAESTRTINSLKKEDFYNGQSLETPAEQIDYLIQYVANEQTKPEAMPFTYSISFLNRIKTVIGPYALDDIKKETVSDMLRRERDFVADLRNELLFARIASTTTSKSNGEIVTYDVDDDELNEERIKNVLGSNHVEPLFTKGKRFKISAEDNNTLRQQSEKLIGLLNNRSIDPFEALRVDEEATPEVSPKTTRKIDTGNKALEHLCVFLGCVENAFDLYGVDKTPFSMLSAAIHHGKSEYSSNKDKFSYLRKELARSSKVQTGLASTLALRFISDLEDSDQSEGAVKGVLYAAMKNATYLSRLHRLPEIKSNAEINKAGAYIFMEPETPKEELKKTFGVLEIKPQSIYIKNKRHSVVLSSSDSDHYEEACETIKSTLNDSSKDPLEALLVEFPYDPMIEHEREKKAAQNAVDNIKVKPEQPKAPQAKEGQRKETAAEERQKRQKARRLEKLTDQWVNAFSGALKEAERLDRKEQKTPFVLPETSQVDEVSVVSRLYKGAVESFGVGKNAGFMIDDLTLEEFEYGYLDEHTINPNGPKHQRQFNYRPTGEHACRITTDVVSSTKSTSNIRPVLSLAKA